MTSAVAGFLSAAKAEAEAEPINDRLVDDFSVLAIVRCPCGSQHYHQLTLNSTAECRRCSRTLGIRSIRYFRAGPGVLPKPEVEIGYVLTEAALAKRETSGVH